MTEAYKEHCLMGKTILGLALATDNLAIKFILSDGESIIAKAWGDCCSSSWIEHITLPGGGFPALVLQVKDIDLPGSCDNHPEHECLEVYGLEIVTDKGSLIIDYRNSSNGFYSGSLSWPGEYHYGGVFNQNVSNEMFSPVTKDV